MLINRCVQAIAVLGVVMIATSTSNVVAQQSLCDQISCLDTGETICDRSTEKCSPCIYSMNEDGYSCYPKSHEQCPFPNTVAICDTGLFPPAAPVAETEAPASKHDEDPGLSVDDKEAPPVGTAENNTTSDNDDLGNPSNITSSSSFDTQRDSAGSTNALSNESKESKTNNDASSKFLSMSLIVIACLAGASVVLFAMRRIKNKHQTGDDDDLTSIFQTRTQNPFTLETNNNTLEDQEFGYNAQTTGKARSKGAVSDVENLMSMHRINSSTGNFSDYMDDEPSQNNQENIKRASANDEEGELNFSSIQPVSQHGATSSADHHHHSDVGKSSSVSSNLSFSKQNSSFQFDKPFESNNIASAEQDSPVLKGEEKQNEVHRMTITSDYDIVDPTSMQHAEGRNTEALVNEGRFRIFSTASRASSYAGSEVDDLSVYSASISSLREMEL